MACVLDAWINELYRHQSICLLLYKIDLRKYLTEILCLSAGPYYICYFLRVGNIMYTTVIPIPMVLVLDTLSRQDLCS
jgi:hypothetical protein